MFLASMFCNDRTGARSLCNSGMCVMFHSGRVLSHGVPSHGAFSLPSPGPQHD